jgi:Domain of unknown function (DUF4349)
MLSPELALELRGARPAASPELRQSVLEVAARAQPRRERRPWLPSLRRVALVAAPAVLALAIASAVIHGLLTSGKKSVSGSNVPQTTQSGVQASGSRFASPRAIGVPTSRARLQQYGASMRIQVDNLDRLSDATKRAMRFARLAGGYVAYVRYSSPAHDRGSTSLVVRVPIDRVQDAIEEYSGLGTILSQKVSVVDVTKAVEEQSREIARIKAELARLKPGPKRNVLEARLDYLTKHMTATVRRAQLARVALDLKTKEHAAAATSRFDRTLSDAGDVLLREAELVLYALIVAGPLLLLGGAVIAAGRFRDRRLLERS